MDDQSVLKLREIRGRKKQRSEGRIKNNTRDIVHTYMALVWRYLQEKDGPCLPYLCMDEKERHYLKKREYVLTLMFH